MKKTFNWQALSEDNLPQCFAVDFLTGTLVYVKDIDGCIHETRVGDGLMWFYQIDPDFITHWSY